MDLKCWPILCGINQSILDKAKLVYVFGHLGRDALVITDDDEVVAYGINKSECLGLGCGDLITDEPRSVTELRKQGVKGFSFGGTFDFTFVVAYTYSGSVYTWGKQIGMDADDTTLVPTPSLISLSTKISIVACGSNHCLALSTKGEVYSWGSNVFGQLGISGVTKFDKPVKVHGLTEKRVVKISCGANFSVVLLDNGQVYAFGSNERCQLGSIDTSISHSSVPKKVNLYNVVIEDVVCGAVHVLALSNIGDLYVWGGNDNGELGLDDTTSRSLPEMNKSIGKVIDIAATFACAVSAAMTEDYEVYMWGDFSEFSFEEPMLVSVKSLQEVFAVFATPKVMYKPIVRQSQLESTSVTLQKAFENKETSDLTIRAEGKDIFVHKSILKLRSEYFRVFLQDHWVDKDQKVLEISRKYDVIYPYIRYLYTGELTIDPLLVLVEELFNLAEEYQDSAFKMLCEENVLPLIGIDNVGHLFSVAFNSNAKNLLEGCISFASKHIREVLRTPAVLEWDADTMREFMTMCEKKKLFRF